MTSNNDDEFNRDTVRAQIERSIVLAETSKLREQIFNQRNMNRRMAGRLLV